MSASFEEKSVWIQLVATLLALAAYTFVAGRMLAEGVTALPAYAGAFVPAVVLMVVLLIIGHAAAAIASRPEGRDERDRLIERRGESESSWVLAMGVVGAITCMLLSIDNVWTAHVLLYALYFSEILGFVLRLVYYRKGV